MRGSDVDASLYWLGRMLESGEDPRYVARRLLVTASEDAGASPAPLNVALAAAQAVQLLVRACSGQARWACGGVCCTFKRERGLVSMLWPCCLRLPFCDHTLLVAVTTGHARVQVRSGAGHGVCRCDE